MRLFLEDEGALDLKLPYEELATKLQMQSWIMRSVRTRRR